jgi:hypothetical protein
VEFVRAAHKGRGEPSRPKPLDIRRRIQGLLRLYSYDLPNCSIARSHLCHEASARPVAQPSRSSATSATDNMLGGTVRHWYTAPLGRTGKSGAILPTVEIRHSVGIELILSRPGSRLTVGGDRRSSEAS